MSLFHSSILFIFLFLFSLYLQMQNLLGLKFKPLSSQVLFSSWKLIKSFDCVFSLFSNFKSIWGTIDSNSCFCLSYIFLFRSKKLLIIFWIWILFPSPSGNFVSIFLFSCFVVLYFTYIWVSQPSKKFCRSIYSLLWMNWFMFYFFIL